MITDNIPKLDSGNKPHKIGPKEPAKLNPMFLDYLRQTANVIKSAKRLVEETIVLTDSPYHDGTECVLVPKTLYLTLKERLDNVPD